MRTQFFTAVLVALHAVAAHAAEMGDHCTMSLSKGVMHQTKCDIKDVYKGKTYCFGSEEAKAEYMMDREATIAKAEAFYAKQEEPVRRKATQQEAMRQIESSKCDLSNLDLGYLEFDGKDLRHCKMVNTSFFGAYLRGANLSGANMQRAYLNLARLENANLSGQRGHERRHRAQGAFRTGCRQPADGADEVRFGERQFRQYRFLRQRPQYRRPTLRQPDRCQPEQYQPQPRRPQSGRFNRR